MAKPRGLSKAVRLRRGALDAVVLAVADGLEEAGRVIVEYASASAPDSPDEPYPTGEGLPKQGGVLVYVEGQKVGGWSTRGPQPNKPKAARLLVKQHSVTAIVGFGFPARLQETGTIKQAADPFLAPARDLIGPNVPNIVGTVARPKIGGKG